jgi:hypothetical protein
MYRDLKNLDIISVKDDKQANLYGQENIIYIGHQNLNETIIKNNCLWDEAFYKQFNLEFKMRWDLFYYDRDFKKEKFLFDKLNPKNEKFILIHNLDSAGTDRIDYNVITKDYKHIYVEKSDTIFDYGFLIAMASEIHCIDSSFKHLVDSIPTMGKLFFHKNFKLRTTSEHNHKKNWIII